jgi:3-oxoacyl-[acyl-carrier protein] reductase
MRARRFGSIINILSTAAIEPAPTLAISSVLRGPRGSMRNLRRSAWPADGVTVNSMPGALLTARTEQFERDRAERESRPVEDIRAELEAALPMRHFLRLEDFGRVVAFSGIPRCLCHYRYRGSGRHQSATARRMATQTWRIPETQAEVHPGAAYHTC